ncbi:MAG: AraC family transcriptional regulator [Nevskia sp.]|nr:AraC family transcriptional regulator [Nevskia sp.]
MLQAANKASPREATMRCASLAGLDALLARRGASLAQVCATVGVDLALLSQPEGRLPVHRFVALLEESARASGDDAIGLRLGCSHGPDSFGPLGDAVMHAADMAGAIANVSRYFFVHQEGACLELRVEGRNAIITYCIRDAEILDYRQDAELSIAKMMNMARIATGCRNLTPSAVYFEHPEPRDSSEHRRIFGAPVYFSQPYNALVVPREMLSMRVSGADLGRLAQLHSLAQARAAQTPPGDDLLAGVRQHILRGLRAGGVSIDKVAAALDLSERTLQRRLGECGATFNELVERMRFELSQRYLRQDHLSLTEIGYLLGYSELSAFSRAFRRWSGVSPIEFRKVTCN